MFIQLVSVLVDTYTFKYFDISFENTYFVNGKSI